LEEIFVSEIIQLCVELCSLTTNNNVVCVWRNWLDTIGRDLEDTKLWMLMSNFYQIEMSAEIEIRPKCWMAPAIATSHFRT